MFIFLYFNIVIEYLVFVRFRDHGSTALNSVILGVIFFFHE